LSSITLSNCLQGFFYDELIAINQKSKLPLSQGMIYYASRMLDDFMESGKFFETVDGKISEKLLGVKLLESNQLSGKQLQTELKDIGDSALFLSGIFSSSLERKTVSPRYYHDIGAMAYGQLNAHVPRVYDIDDFFRILSRKFEYLAMILTILSEKFFSNAHDGGELLLISPVKLKAS